MNSLKEIKGNKVPAIGLGTYQLEGDECEKAVSQALDIGYKHIDTAQAYGNELHVGNAIGQSGVERDKIFLTTKAHWEHLKPKEVLGRFEESINKLKTDYVDLFLIHWPSPQGVPMEETLDAMLELKDKSQVKHIGVSNFTPQQVEEALTHTEIFCNQVEYHPFLDQSDLLHLCQKHDVMLTAYCPVVRGKVADEESIERIAKKYNKTPFQVTLRWLVQQDQVVAIPKSGDEQHMKDNINVFDFKLDDDDMETITNFEKEKRLIDPEQAPVW